MPSPLSAVSPSICVLPVLTSSPVLYRASSRAPQIGLSVSVDASHQPSPSASSQSPSANSVDASVAPPSKQSSTVSTEPADSRAALPFRRDRSKVTPGPIFLPKRADAADSVEAALSQAAPSQERTSSGIRLAGDDMSVHSLTSSPRSIKGRSRLPPLSSLPAPTHTTNQSLQPQQAQRIVHVLRLSVTAPFTPSSATDAASAATDSNSSETQMAQGTSEPTTHCVADHQPTAVTDIAPVAPQHTINPSTMPLAPPATLSVPLPSAVASPLLLSHSSSSTSSSTSTSTSHPSDVTPTATATATLSASTCTTAAGSSSPSAAKGATTRPVPTATKHTTPQPPSDEQHTARSTCGCFTALLAIFASKPNKPTLPTTQLVSFKRKRTASAAPQRVWSDNPKYAYELTPPPLMLQRPPAIPRCLSAPTLLPSAVVQSSEQGKLKELRLAIRRSFSGAVSSRHQHSQMPDTLRRRLGAYNSSQRDSITRSDRGSTTADLLRRMPSALRLHMQLPVDNSAQNSPLITDRAISAASVVR